MNRIDNQTRIKVLEEMGFEYQATREEDGSLREHILTHESWKGLFINHTNLICAARHALIGIRVLGLADAQQKYYTIMDLLRNTRMKHGKCLPRDDRACTHCNAVDDINRLIDDYKGAELFSTGGQCQTKKTPV